MLKAGKRRLEKRRWIFWWKLPAVARLKKLKERQEINIRLQIDYECAMEEIRRKNIEKMKLKEEKEEKKRLEKQHQLLEKLRKEEEKEKEKKKREEEYKQKMEEKRKRIYYYL